MTVLDVRRHAERGASTALNQRGERSAAALAGPRYALVVSSPLERAKRTAELAGGRLDAMEPGLLPDIGGAGVFGPMAALADWRALLHADPKAGAFALEQLATWARLAGRVKDRDRVLAISHGGIIELPIVALAEQLRVAIDGPSFGFLEGARITYEKGAPAKIEVLRSGS
ncbi:MAG TPA: histidine phosphatase family protein [Candidatus Limnocylindria bacterium]|nr:histidine phosphatase family protein [Candidatus Limnocylindria bacterium]